MNENTDHHLREENLAFFAKIGAGVSHEMRNVLSIVGEYAGLLSDLMAAAQRGKSVESAKLAKLAASITRQVKKGTEAMERFSRFAHAADQLMGPADLTALTQNTVALVQRHGDVPGCTLEVDLPETAIPTTTNPFSLQQAVFHSIQLMLQTAGENQPVAVQLTQPGPAAQISVSDNARDDGRLAGGISAVSVLMEELGGRAEATVADGRRSVTLTLPIAG
jgi:light-regulated signal transduction histidine kinase (bacteriophytochrome)